MVATIVLWTIQSIFVIFLSPMVVGVIKKIKAHFQGRQGPSIIQPYKDIYKLFMKDEVVSEDASWIFRISPYVIFSSTVVAGSCIPAFTVLHPLSGASDFLFIVYLLALGTFFLALSGIDTGSAFGGFGSSREMTIAALAEGGLIFSLLVPVFRAHTTSLGGVAGMSLPASVALYAPLVLAFLGFIIAMLAETGRFPFDNPATHLELTMIHEAMILENSGKNLALMEWASANKLIIYITLAGNLFFPFGISSTPDVAAICAAIVLYLVKTAVLAFFIAVLESSIAKYRYFRLPDILFTSFIMSAVAIGLSIGW